ncbi:Rv3654c family TadE-like protein [Fodinibacter luteus]|uniref:Rv3654c family TadE-like protein n=1 Tax=Fodinibacter luteus TaxID=552064 RepID=UPI0031EFB8F6
MPALGGGRTVGPGAEEGSATVLVVGAAAAVTVVLAGVLVVVGVVRDAHRAGAAADLAALAAAAPSLTGAGTDCGSAAAVAQANGAELTGCRPAHDGSVLVQVRVVLSPPAGWGWLPDAVVARARAGTVTEGVTDGG